MVDCDGWACKRSTPRDDIANGAHNMQGPTDEWSLIQLVSELDIFYIICAAWVMMQYFSDEKFSSLENIDDPSWRMTRQTEHTTQGSTDGRRSKLTTRRIGILWRMMQQMEHTLYSSASNE